MYRVTRKRWIRWGGETSRGRTDEGAKRPVTIDNKCSFQTELTWQWHGMPIPCSFLHFSLHLAIAMHLTHS